MSDLLLTVDQVAELLHTTPHAIHCALARGKQPLKSTALRVGRKVLFRREKLFRALGIES